MTALTVAVFVAVYLGMALGRWPGLRIDRTGIALLGAILLYVAGAVDGSDAVRAIDFPTLFLLFALMVLSSQFAASGFYAWCSATIAATPVGPTTLLALVVAVAGILAAVLANDVVVFAMTPMLCTGLLRRGLDPRPFLIALASAANAGSAATIIGNPQNILIAQVGDLDFVAFLAVCGPPAAGALLVVHLVVATIWRGRFMLAGAELHEARAAPTVENGAMIKALVLLVALIVVLVSPAPDVEGALAVAGCLLISRTLATRRMLGQVDWHLLVLFAGLFVVTAALEKTGLPAALVATMAQHGLNLHDTAVLAPLAVVGSNTIGNVPLVVLVLTSLGQPDPFTLYGLALVSTLAGNLLLVGSLANIITVERARELGVVLTFREHAACGVPITMASLAVAIAWLAWIR